MHVSIYTERLPRNVEPGDVIDAGTRGPLRVDEVVIRSDKVHILGYPLAAVVDATPRRKTVTVKPDDTVRILPTDETSMLVWGELTNGVSAGIAYYEDSADGVAPWATSGDVILVTHGNEEFTVRAEPDPEPDPDPAEENGPVEG